MKWNANERLSVQQFWPWTFDLNIQKVNSDIWTAMTKNIVQGIKTPKNTPNVGVVRQFQAKSKQNEMAISSE